MHLSGLALRAWEDGVSVSAPLELPERSKNLESTAEPANFEEQWFLCGMRQYRCLLANLVE
jgi:hypothetical protein